MRRRALTGLFILGSAALLTGCYSGPGGDIRRNPSPELATLHQREVDIDNALTITFDENLRMFTQDLGRAFYTDRPSRLTREPIPY